MACRPYNTGRCLLLRLFNPSKLWGSLQFLFHMTDKRLHAKVQQFCELTAISPHLFIYNVLRQAVSFGCLTLFKDLVLFF